MPVPSDLPKLSLVRFEPSGKFIFHCDSKGSYTRQQRFEAAWRELNRASAESPRLRGVLDKVQAPTATFSFRIIHPDQEKTSTQDPFRWSSWAEAKAAWEAQQSEGI